MQPGPAATKRSRSDVTRINGGITAALLDKASISKWLREDLEDKYLSLYQDHGKLKEKFRAQEDKIRDYKQVLKKKQDQIRQLQVGAGAGASELRATDQVVKLELRNVELEKHNSQLKQRVTLLQSQLAGGSARPSSAAALRQRGGANTRMLRPASGGDQRQRSLGRSDDMKNEQTRLQFANSSLQVEIEALKERLYSQEAEHQRRLQELQSDLDIARLQSGDEKRVALQDDLDKVRLQRELREKSVIIEQLQARSEANEERMRETLDSNTRFLEELERLKRELRVKDKELESHRENSSVGQASRRKVMELEQALEDANKEAKILKEANDKLTNTAFNTERERQWKSRESALVTQIQQLESTMRRDCGEKGQFLDRLEEQRDKGDEVEKELSSIRLKYYELQQQHELLKDKMKFFTKESAVDLNEVEEALVLVKQRRQQSQSEQLEFLEEVDAEASRDTQRRLQEMEAAHADTIQELEKTRQLLEAQYRINLDLKASHSLAESHLEEVKSDSENRMGEYAKLLDIRAARIRKLERQLRDVAYGTKQFGIDTAALAEANGVEEIDETVHLRNGENLVEFHVGRLLLTDEARAILGDNEPSLFCTWAFYMCELQTSDVTRGSTHDFDKTVQYIVKVDDNFLHYINKEKVKVELFQSVGMKYHSVASGRVSFRELLDAKPGDAVHGKASLIADSGDSVGVLEFWFRMRVPMEQAMRLYRERAKALGYMSANHQQAAEGMRALDDVAEQRRPADSDNELCVRVVRCSNLRARRQDFQPTPYFTFKFFDCEDCVSPAIPNSEQPEFHFTQRLPLQLSPALDKYLRTQKLLLYVLDEADPDESALLGVARIDLVSLSQNRAIQGTHQLFGTDNQPSGTIELEMNWQFAYLPPASWRPNEEPLPLMTGEAEIMHQQYQQQQQQQQQLQSSSKPPSPKKRQQQQQQQLQSTLGETPQAAVRGGGSRSASRSGSRAGSVAEEACVEQIQGVDPGDYKRHQSSQRRPDSAKVASDLSRSLVAPSDRPLPSESECDAESVHSEVAQPQRIEQPQPQPPSDYHHITDESAVHDSVTESITSITETNGRNATTGASDEAGTLHPHAEEDEEDEEEYEDDDDEYDEHEFEPESEEQDNRREAAEESDGLVVDDKSYRLSQTGPLALNECVVQIYSVHFDEEASALRSEDLRNTTCFVSFAMPGYQAEDCETPNSLSMPRPGQSKRKDFDLYFNFEKTFRYDFENNYEKRVQLASLLLQEKVVIPFNVVCEAGDEENDFFTELAKPVLRLDPLMTNAESMEDVTLTLEHNGERIGTMKVGTTLPTLLMEVYNELPDDKKERVTVIAS